MRVLVTVCATIEIETAVTLAGQHRRGMARGASNLVVLARKREGCERVSVATEFVRQTKPVNIAVTALAVVAEVRLMHGLVTVDAAAAAGGRSYQTAVVACLARDFAVPARDR